MKLEESKIKELIDVAISNINNSYAPYSHFNVSAALLCKSKKIYWGVNIENASYGASICAERVAITSAIKEGEREIEAIAIVGGKDFEVKEYCYPCGICRQFMSEFCNPKEMTVIIAKSNTDYKIYTLDELLPESFKEMK